MDSNLGGSDKNLGGWVRGGPSDEVVKRPPKFELNPESMYQIKASFLCRDVCECFVCNRIRYYAHLQQLLKREYSKKCNLGGWRVGGWPRKTWLFPLDLFFRIPQQQDILLLLLLSDSCKKRRAVGNSRVVVPPGFASTWNLLTWTRIQPHAVTRTCDIEKCHDP